jgi:hypothetical protein
MLLIGMLSFFLWFLGEVLRWKLVWDNKNANQTIFFCKTCKTKKIMQFKFAQNHRGERKVQNNTPQNVFNI